MEPSSDQEKDENIAYSSSGEAEDFSKRFGEMLSRLEWIQARDLLQLEGLIDQILEKLETAQHIIQSRIEWKGCDVMSDTLKESTQCNLNFETFDLLSEVESLSAAFRSLVKPVLEENMSCLNYWRKKKCELRFFANCPTDDDTVSPIHHTFDSCNPGAKIVLECIAKCFLHSSRFELFDTFSEELEALRSANAKESHEFTQEYSVTRLDMTPQSFSSTQQNSEESKSLKIQKELYVMSDLVDEDFVLACKEFNRILQALKARDIFPAFKWFQIQSNSRAYLHERFGFALCEAQFFQLVSFKSQSDLDWTASLLEYIAKDFVCFQKSYPKRISALCGALALYEQLQSYYNKPAGTDNVSFCNKKLFPFWKYNQLRNINPVTILDDGTAPYTDDEDLLSRMFNQLCKEFKRVFSSDKVSLGIAPDSLDKQRNSTGDTDKRIGETVDVNKCESTVKHTVAFPAVSPLNVLAAAGMASLPKLHRLIQSMSSLKFKADVEIWKEMRLIPLDIDLQSFFHFHSKFSCPVCRSPDMVLYLRGGPPCRLTCGHLICQACVRRLAFRSRNRTVKCPMCPQETPSTSVRFMSIRWECQ